MNSRPRFGSCARCIALAGTALAAATVGLGLTIGIAALPAEYVFAGLVTVSAAVFLIHLGGWVRRTRKGIPGPN